MIKISVLNNIGLISKTFGNMAPNIDKLYGSIYHTADWLQSAKAISKSVYGEHVRLC